MLMENMIKEIKEYTSKLEIPETQVIKLIELINKKLRNKSIIDFFISNAKESYGEEGHPLQVNFYTNNHLFEFKLGTHEIYYDLYPLQDIKLVKLFEEEKTKVYCKLFTHLADTKTHIVTYDASKFQKLKDFVDKFENIIYKF